MKIAIPVEETNINSKVCKSFGRAPFFLFYDTETKENVFLNNSATFSSGGAGIKAAQTIVDQKAEVLLTPQCGENAANVFQVGGVKIYKTQSDSVQENIDAFTAQELLLLTEIHTGFHGHKGQ